MVEDKVFIKDYDRKAREKKEMSINNRKAANARWAKYRAMKKNKDNNERVN